MNAPKAIMLFAAGFGTRMGKLTADCPKPLVEVLNKPLIDHTLDIVENFGPLRKVVNTHYKAPMLADHLAGRDILISDEQPDICLLYTSPSPRDRQKSRMPSSA